MSDLLVRVIDETRRESQPPVPPGRTLPALLIRLGISARLLEVFGGPALPKARALAVDGRGGGQSLERIRGRAVEALEELESNADNDMLTEP